MNWHFPPNISESAAKFSKVGTCDERTRAQYNNPS